MSYLDYFGLRHEPFSNAPVSRFYFDDEQRTVRRSGACFTCVERMKGLAVLVGDVGAGKSTLARRLLDQLPGYRVRQAAPIVIMHSQIATDWLLQRMALQLGVPEPAQDRVTILAQLYKRLVQIYEEGRKAVVLIDEAQMLQSREIMEEFRGLLNLEVPERKLLSFVFFGLPELEENLKLDPPLQQRVAMRYRLETLTPSDTAAYLEYRLKQAGTEKRPFSDEAVATIHAATHGTPRAINTLADNALLEAYFDAPKR